MPDGGLERVPNLISTQQAADLLGITSRRVRALIASGKLPAQRVGRDWLINPKHLDFDRTPGRPSKR